MGKIYFDVIIMTMCPFNQVNKTEVVKSVLQLYSIFILHYDNKYSHVIV